MTTTPTSAKGGITGSHSVAHSRGFEGSPRHPIIERLTTMSDEGLRIHLSLDGSHACALLGENLQVGEAEFEPIKGWPTATYADERQAVFTAKSRLEKRLGLPWTSYYLGQGLQA